MSGPSFDDLREQTKRNRQEFLRTEVGSCRVFLDMAETEYRIGSRDAAQRSIHDAEVGCETLDHFLSDPKHPIEPAVRKEIEMGLEECRRRLRALKEDFKRESSG